MTTTEIQMNGYLHTLHGWEIKQLCSLYDWLLSKAISEEFPNFSWHNFKTNLVQSCLAVCFYLFCMLWMFPAICFFFVCSTMGGWIMSWSYLKWFVLTKTALFDSVDLDTFSVFISYNTADFFLLYQLIWAGNLQTDRYYLCLILLWFFKSCIWNTLSKFSLNNMKCYHIKKIIID